MAQVPVQNIAVRNPAQQLTSHMQTTHVDNKSRLWVQLKQPQEETPEASVMLPAALLDPFGILRPAVRL